MAIGIDKIFATDLPKKSLAGIAVMDTTGICQKMLASIDVKFTDLKKGLPDKENVLVINGVMGDFLRRGWHNHTELLEWVADGNTIICVKGTDEFAAFLERKEILNYSGKQEIGKVWYGGNYFVKQHPFFNGLPNSVAFNWEYQSLAGYDMQRYGLKLNQVESVVGVYADHRAEVYDAVAVAHYGKGKIILSTLDLEKAIKRNDPSSIVAKRILYNYLQYAL